MCLLRRPSAWAGLYMHSWCPARWDTRAGLGAPKFLECLALLAGGGMRLTSRSSRRDSLPCSSSKYYAKVQFRIMGFLLWPFRCVACASLCVVTTPGFSYVAPVPISRCWPSSRSLHAYDSCENKNCGSTVSPSKWVAYVSRIKSKK